MASVSVVRKVYARSKTGISCHVLSCVKLIFTREIELAAPGAFAGTAAVRCDVAAPAVTGAKIPRNGFENVSFTGRQL